MEPLSVPMWVSLSSLDALSCESRRLVPVGARQAVATPWSPPPHTHTTYSETRGWPRSGLLPSGLPRSGEETDASAPFYGKVFSG